MGGGGRVPGEPFDPTSIHPMRRNKAASAGPNGPEKRRPDRKPQGPGLPAGWYRALLPALLALFLYAPSYFYDFVYDDDAVIRNNRFVQLGWEGLSDIWTTSYFEGYDAGMKARAYRPFPLTTLAISYAWAGLDPRFHHLVNIILYALTAVLLYRLLDRLLGRVHPWVPLLTCLFFVAHPVHTEVVANIKSRDTLLGFLGMVGAALYLLRAYDRRRPAWLVAASASLFVGLTSKEEVVTAAAWMPLLLYTFRTCPPGRAILFTAPLGLTVLLYLGIRSAVLGGLNEGVTLTYLDNSLLAAADLAERSASTVYVLGYYLWKSLVPYPLLSDYSWQTLPLVGWTDLRVYAALGANLLLLAYGIRGLRRRTVYGFAVLHHFISLSIFSNLVLTNVSVYNDRFLYTPVLGTCLAVAFLVSRLERATGEPGAGIRWWHRNFRFVAAATLVTVMGVAMTTVHLPVWRNATTLFTHDAQAAPGNARVRKNLGGALAQQAVARQTTDPERARAYAAAAIQQLDTALVLYPGMPTGWIHKGNMHILLEEYEAAVSALQNALRDDPDNYFAKASLGNVQYRLGDYEAAAGVLESIPENSLRASDHQLLGRIYQRLDQPDKAAGHWQKAGF